MKYGKTKIHKRREAKNIKRSFESWRKNNAGQIRYIPCDLLFLEEEAGGRRRGIFWEKDLQATKQGDKETGGRKPKTKRVGSREGTDDPYLKGTSKKALSLNESKSCVRNYMGLGLKGDQALEIAEISKDQFYYQPKEGKRGRSVSTHTIRKSDQGEEQCPNSEVVKKIRQQKSKPDLNYGYHKMTYHLQLEGYLINDKKVYRLMKEHGLLEVRRKGGDKKYVKYRVVIPKRPLEVLEMDIKQVWVEEHRRYAYILTIIDTFTRAVLYYTVGYQMRQAQVKAAWTYVIEQHLQPADALRKDLHIEVRNDNGPQFGAKAIQTFFKENQLNQVFTHPYTPQENGHVESFHGILAKHLNLNTYWTLTQLEQDLTLFYERYNNERLHGSTAHLPPNTFCSLSSEGLIQRIEKDYKKVQFKLKIPYYEVKAYIGK